STYEFRTVRKSGVCGSPAFQRSRFLAQARVPIASESAGKPVRTAPMAGGCGVVELNTKARYAVMAMADLAKCGAPECGGQGGAVPLSAIAERQNLSIAYLEQIFLRLRRAGLVESARGRTGGYVLARRAKDISIAEIMEAV